MEGWHIPSNDELIELDIYLGVSESDIPNWLGYIGTDEGSKMAKIVQQMIKESLDSLINFDLSLAKKVCKSDDRVDNLHRDMYPLVESKIDQEPDKKTMDSTTWDFQVSGKVC